MARARRKWHLVVDRYGKNPICWACGRRGADYAHVLGREHDDRKTGIVNPDDIIPLCGPPPTGCHGAYDAHRIDIARFLTAGPIRRAIELVGPGLAARRIRSSRDPEPLVLDP
jgi:hypothetical protein